jgi:hypothetical protein
MILLRLPHLVEAILPIACALLPARTMVAQAPWWRDSLGYSSAELHPIRVGTDGFPYVRVRVDTMELSLLFDTGNMVGMTLATPQYDRLALRSVGTVRRRDSAGEPLGEFRIGRAERVQVLGRTATEVTIYEFRHPRLAGLVGPDALPGSRFTLDYRAQVLAVTTSDLDLREGANRLALIRSARHPRLIVVEGRFRGEPILIELDTGKSRTAVDPVWARSVGLAVGRLDTVVVGEIQVGGSLCDIRDAKPVRLGAIDPDLPAPLVISLGSDTLSRFILTVDYGRGLVLLWETK